MNKSNILSFFSIIKKLIKSDIAFLAIFSMVLIGFYNNYDFKNITVIWFSYSLFIVFLACFILLISLSFSHKILKIFLVILLFFSTINLYIRNKYGYILDEIMIANALDSLGHINDATDYNLIINLLFFSIIPSIIIIKIKFHKNNFKIKSFSILLALILIGILIIFSPKFITNYAVNSISPSSYISASYRYYQRFRDARLISKNRQSLTKFYNFSQQNITEKKQDDLKIILVIGESLRADHLEIFGYNRNTTPNLSTKKNLLRFRSQAFYPITTPSVTDLLSHRLNSQFMDIPPEKSIVDLMKNLGFKSYWYSMQSSKQFGTEMLNIMAMEADDYFFRDRIHNDLPDHKNLYDEDLLPYFSKIIKNNEKSFIILHSFGSHTHYFERYTDSYRKFIDECKTNLKICSQEQIFNSYDNSILYTDYFLNEVIRMVDQSNAIMFYISDHGSFLGENGVFANGNIDEVNGDAHIVPMFVYFSEKILKNNYLKQKFLNAKNNQDKLLNHDYLFDSVLDCSGIKSDLINSRKLSVCSRI